MSNYPSAICPSLAMRGQGFHLSTRSKNNKNQKAIFWILIWPLGPSSWSSNTNKLSFEIPSWSSIEWNQFFEPLRKKFFCMRGGFHNPGKSKKIFFLNNWNSLWFWLPASSLTISWGFLNFLRKKNFFWFSRPPDPNPFPCKKTFFLKTSKNGFRPIEDHQGIPKLTLFVLGDKLEGPKGQVKIRKMADFRLSKLQPPKSTSRLDLGGEYKKPFI